MSCLVRACNHALGFLGNRRDDDTDWLLSSHIKDSEILTKITEHLSTDKVIIIVLVLILAAGGTQYRIAGNFRGVKNSLFS